MKAVFSLITFGVIALCSFATAARWVEDDTVIITDEPSRVERDLSSEYFEAVVQTPSCTTTRGVKGTCRSLRDCYPVLYPLNKNMTVPEGTLNEVTLNDRLAAILVKIAGVCDVPATNADEMLTKVAKSQYLICCTQPEEVPTPTPLPPEQPNTSDDDQKGQRNCGSIKVDPSSLPPLLNNTKVVNGRVAARGEFPWIVALMNQGREFCGSSLINNQWVVTAAHCVQHMQASDVANLRLQIGDHDIYSTTDGRHEVRAASRVLFHKGFSMQHLHDDVALIKLSSPVQFTNLIQPICIHSGGSVDGRSGDVAGWGQLYENGPQPSTLRTANAAFVSQEDCKAKYNDIAPAGIGNGMICSGGDGRDSCRGDSGGPLTIDSRSSPRLVGIVSFGVECGTLPGVYTRASAYQSWISRNIATK